MASLGHLAVGMAAGRFWSGLGVKPSGGRRRKATLAREMAAFSALSLTPDLDVLAFRLHIPYSAPFGHRGATHSICTALLLGVIATVASHLTNEQKAGGQT